VVGGPVVPRPQEGWTQATADVFCGDYIRYHTLDKCYMVNKKNFESFFSEIAAYFLQVAYDYLIIII
jgi:hypothetical protein